ncbi:hypothetical protein BSLG_007688 [Batrachochytrium salamandrivorans]|nr:hypothetical protein BSLG_007688 [Batrachochytrium salamandrivorans]
MTTTAFEFGLPTPSTKVVSSAGLHPIVGTNKLMDHSTPSPIVTRTPKTMRTLGFKDTPAHSGVDYSSITSNGQDNDDDDGGGGGGADDGGGGGNGQEEEINLPEISSKVQHPRYSFMITSETTDGPLMDLVTVYRAEALFDYTPTTFVDPDGSGDAAVTPISLTAGEWVSVFGNNSVGFTDTATGEFWRSSRVESVHHSLDIVSDVNVSGGWCHVEREDGKNGYAPIAYLKFESFDGVNDDELPAQANLRESTPSFSIDPKPHHRLSAGNYLTSFPAPPADPSMETYVDEQQSQKIAIADILSPSKMGMSIQSIWSSMFQNNDALREFILRGPVVDPSAVIRQRIQSSISTYNIYNSNVMSVIPSCYVIESKNNMTMMWKSQIGPCKIVVHSPRRCRHHPSNKRNDFILYKITTMFAGSRSDDSEEAASVTVERRYNDFTFLHAYLAAIFPVSTMVTLPAQLPPRNLLQPKYDETHIGTRLKGLQLYLDHISRHPILRSEDSVIQFLTSYSVETDFFGADEGNWLLDRDSCTIVANSGEWRRGYDLPSVNNPTYSFFEHVIVPETTAFSSLSLSTFKLRSVETISELLANRILPFIDSTFNYQSNTKNMHVTFLEMSRALLNTGRLLSRTGDDQPSCWNPSCKDCGPIGDAMISASLQLKHIAEIYSHHESQDIESVVQKSKQIKASMGLLSSLTHMFRTATDTVQQHFPAGNGSAVDGTNDGLSGIQSADGYVRSLRNDASHTATPHVFFPHTQQQQQLQSQQQRAVPTRSGATQTDIQQRAAVVLAVAESEALQAHSEKIFMIEDTMSTWLDSEIDMHEKILKRLRAAKEAFRGINQRL